MPTCSGPALHTRSLCGAAPGKVILLGEHAVVYGRAAIAAAIDRGITVTLEAAAGSARFDQDDDPRLAQALARAAELLGVVPAGFVVSVTSDLPRAMGLGSSAALSVALVRALARRAGRNLEAVALSALAFEIETIFHGTPSGIDNSVAAYGGLIGFRRGAAVRPLASARTIPLVIALGRAPRHTRQTVGALRERWQAAPATYEQLFDEVNWLVMDAERAIAAGDFAELGTLMNTNHGVLYALGVSTDELESMVTLARAHGALGAKLTGGGGGGAVICLCPDGREQVVQAFEQAGWQAFATEIAEGRGADGRDDATSSEQRRTVRA